MQRLCVDYPSSGFRFFGSIDAINTRTMPVKIPTKNVDIRTTARPVSGTRIHTRSMVTGSGLNK